MSEFPESFAPLDLPEVPDVPRSGAAHEIPRYVRALPDLGAARPCAVTQYGRTGRGAAPGHPTPGVKPPRSRRGRSRERRAAAQPLEAGGSRSVAPVSHDTFAERRSSEAGSGFRGRVHALSVGYYRADGRDPFPRGRPGEAGTVLGRAE
jgi:hypothetical protein